MRGKIDEWSKDTLYNVCRGLQPVEEDDGGNMAKGIPRAASSTGFL